MQYRDMSTKWVQSFGIFKDKKLQFFLEGGSELLCSYAYPYAGPEQLRTACDFINLLFVVDETCDDLDGPEAAKTCDVFLRAMKGEVLEGTAAIRMTRE